MKTIELKFDVDFIGEQSKLTIAEEKSLSDYFKQKKAISSSIKSKISVRKTKTRVL